MGETAEDAVLREVFEETGVHYEISFYFRMKSRGTRELHNNSTVCGVKEEMHWIPINDLDKYKAFPSFMKDYLSKEHYGIEHIITDERK